MAKYVLCIDVGGTLVKIAYVLLEKHSFKIIAKKSIPTVKNKNKLLNSLIVNINGFQTAAKNKKQKISGIGIGLPGEIDFKNGVIHNLTNIPGWKNVAFKKIIEKKTGLPVFIDNDANLMALGEYVYGAGRGAQNMVGITLGTGVGGGIIIGGKLYHGSSMTAGEIGHICIDINGPKCNCGGFGCLERYVGNRYIVEEAIRRLRMGQDSILRIKFKNNYKKITPLDLGVAAKSNDKFSLHLWQDIARFIGTALAGIVNVINPDYIIIGGGIANAGKFLFSAINKEIRVRALSTPAKKVKVIKARLGADAGIIGAAAMVNMADV